MTEWWMIMSQPHFPLLFLFFATLFLSWPLFQAEEKKRKKKEGKKKKVRNRDGEKSDKKVQLSSIGKWRLFFLSLSLFPFLSLPLSFYLSLSLSLSGWRKILINWKWIQNGVLRKKHKHSLREEGRKKLIVRKEYLFFLSFLSFFFFLSSTEKSGHNTVNHESHSYQKIHNLKPHFFLSSFF